MVDAGAVAVVVWLPDPPVEVDWSFPGSPLPDSLCGSVSETNPDRDTGLGDHASNDSIGSSGVNLDKSSAVAATETLGGRPGHS